MRVTQQTQMARSRITGPRAVGGREAWPWWRRGALAAVVYLVCAHTLHAQTISMKPDSRKRLAHLVATDANAGKVFARLQKEADSALGDPGHPITNLRTASTLEADEAKIKTKASLRDMKVLEALGYAYAATEKPAYAKAAQRMILNWAAVNQPSGSPVDETKLEPLFMAYDLTHPSFSEAEQKKVETWLLDIAEREKKSGEKKGATSMNNWQSHRLKIVGQIGFLLGNKPYIDYAVQGYKQQIEANLRPDGSSYDFHERDALHYHCYDLEPLLSLAVTAELNGVSLYHYEAPNGASLPKAVAFLAPYCLGEKTHAEYVESKVAFDQERAKAGEEKFEAGTLFNPQDGRKVFELAAFFDPSWLKVVSHLDENLTSRRSSWRLVLNQVERQN